MGIEDFIKNLKPKTKKLFDNMISIGIIFTLLYGVLVFVIGGYINKPISFFQDKNFITIVLLLVFLGVFYKLLHGGKIHVPQQSTQGKKKQLNMPNYWGAQPLKSTSKTKTRTNSTRKKSKKSTIRSRRGSWICPQCDTLNVNRISCKKCRYKNK